MLTFKDLAPFKRWIALYYALYALLLVGIVTDIFSSEVRWILATVLLLFALVTQWMAISRRRKQRRDNLQMIEEFVHSSE
ncbi:MAG: hypothetical protein JSS75_13315 [Bacteroidetes bacterium]|nr:hypothetical protein [Bacteroidota bacterium]